MNEETIKRCNTCAPKGMTYSLQNGRPQVMLSEDFMKAVFGGQSMMDQGKALAEMMANGDFGPEYMEGGKVHRSADMASEMPIAKPTPLGPFSTQPAMTESQNPPFAKTELLSPASTNQRNYTSAELFGAEILGSGSPSGGGEENFTLAQTDAADVLPGGATRPKSDIAVGPKDKELPDFSKGEQAPSQELCQHWKQTYHTSIDVGYWVEIWRKQKCYTDVRDYDALRKEGIDQAQQHLTGDGDAQGTVVQEEMKKTISTALGRGVLPYGITLDRNQIVQAAVDGKIAEWHENDPTYQPCLDFCPDDKICVLRVADVERFAVTRIDPTNEFEVKQGEFYPVGRTMCFDIYIMAKVVVHIDAIYTLSCDCVLGV